MQILASVGREIISHSWGFASVFIKFYILTVLTYLYSQDKLQKTNFKQKILEDSRFVVAGVALIGTVLFILGIELSPLKYTLFSELAAFLYLGYLFWVY